MSKLSTCLMISCLLIFIQPGLYAQSRPTIQWQKCLGGTGDDRANDVLINPDGTFIVVGSSTSNDGNVSGHHGNNDSTDAWMVKLSADGDIIWQRSFGGTKEDYFKSVIATSDNNYLCIGYTRSTNGDVTGNHGTGDAWIVKVDDAGNIIWSKCYGGSQNDMAVQGVKTIDDNYAIIGSSGSGDGNAQCAGGWVFKIDNSGNILWQNCMGDQGYSIILSEDNNLYALSSSANPYTFTGGVPPQNVQLVANPGGLYKLNNTTGNVSGIGSVGGDSCFAMCRTANATHVSLIEETYFYLEYCFTEYSYIAHKPDGSNTITKQQVYDQFTRTCSFPYNDAYLVAPTHGMAAAETGSGMLVAGGELIRSGFYHWMGWLTDLYGFNSSYGDDYSDTYFKSVKVFPNGNDYIVVGYTNGNFGDISGNHGGANDCWVLRLSGLNRIVGNVFIDANNNGIKDAGELPYNHASVKSTKAGFEVRAFPYNGFYSNTVDLGTFTTTVALNRPYYTVTPASKISTFSTYKNVDTANFAVHAIPGIVDYAVSVGSLLPPRPGFPLQYSINYSNRGTTTLTNKNVVFIKDPRQQLVSSVPPYTSIVGDSIKWNIASLPIDGTGNIILNMQLDALANINDTLESAVYIDSISDVYRADNFVPIRERISGSYDPNDKQEIHGGFITPQELAARKYLDYTIRFQNTGNDTAFNIILRDTLDANLQWDSIEITGSSHAYQANLKNSRYLSFTFNNIKLVDSNHNEPLSHGYISYRIKPLSTLVLGDTIRNSASICFDFNQPIKTNTQVTIIRSRPVPVTWTGAVSKAWEDPLNWSNAAVPDANTNVTINNGMPRYPEVNSNAVCRSLDVKTGASITVKTGFAIKILH